ncbi:MAG TPA: HAD-IC family P-type ATPase, partial [Verrucomicrobiae bacterium]|nr:HAD-IC family P-type ATPase [Verrucomicrobiae bacterium]
MSGACEYTPPKHESEKSDKTLDIFRLIAMFTVIVFIAWLHELPSALISNLVIIITVVTCGYPIFKESFSALKKGRINMELSMVIAIIASLLLLQFLPAIVITFFALLSEFIEGLIVEKGRKNIELLYKRAPKKAIVKREQNSMANNSENTMTKIIKQEEIPIEKVKINDVIIVREGDIIPIDGQILMGASTIDQSSITGESIPVDKHVGDFVFAGTINLSSYLEVLCKRVSNDTTFAKIIHLVEESEDAKAPIQKMSDKLATRVIQFAIFLSIITFITTQNLVSTLSVIVVAGACGLAVGTPVAILSSNSKLAKNGVIIKGGLQIENIKNAGTIVFDKTGTLTIGRPVVKKIISFDEKMNERKILEYAARAEQNVNHPLAKAIVEKAINEKIEFEYSGENKSKNKNNNINNKFQVKVGKGASLFYNGHMISVGSFSYIKEQCSLDDKTQKLNSQSLTLSNKKLITNKDFMDISNDADTSRDKYYQYLLSDATTVFVSSDKQIIGVILIEDEVRFGTREVISQIKMMGLHPIMLTGDNENVAKK